MDGNWQILDPDVISEEKRTFGSDEELPSLHVPDLQHTLQRYLDSGGTKIFREKLKVDVDNKRRKMCMKKMRLAFSSCRVPGVFRDQLITHFRRAVLYRGRFFSLDMVDEQKETNPPPPPRDPAPIDPHHWSVTGKPKGRELTHITFSD